MTALALCFAAFVSVAVATKRSLKLGIIVMFAWGYFYGILRANVVQIGSHFTFDAALAGLFVALLANGLTPEQRQRIQPLRAWTIVLCVWPIFMFLVPIQDMFVQLVGLRANVLLLPFMLVGLLLDKDDRAEIGHGLAILNLVAFAFALWEYVYGIQAFYPRNEVTELIYRSRDLIGNRFYRIPATFTSAHAYGGMMVTTLPFVLEAFVDDRRRFGTKLVYGASVVATILGVFMCAARTPALLLVGLLGATLLYAKMSPRLFAAMLVIGLTIGWVVMTNERMQRFTSLQDTDYVSERLSSSVNSNFFTLLVDYPMGNGMGAGGTSMPYFLEGRIVGKVVQENDYSRILLEQGFPGLLLWVSFIGWLFLRTLPVVGRGAGFRSNGLGDVGKKLVWFNIAATFLSGATGLGMFASIPGSALFLLSIGWICEKEDSARSRVSAPVPIRDAARQVPVVRGFDRPSMPS